MSVEKSTKEKQRREFIKWKCLIVSIFSHDFYLLYSVTQKWRGSWYLTGKNIQLNSTNYFLQTPRGEESWNLSSVWKQFSQLQPKWFDGNFPVLYTGGQYEYLLDNSLTESWQDKSRRWYLVWTPAAQYFSLLIRT